MYGNGDLFSDRNWTRAVCTDLLSESMIWLDPAEKSGQIGLFQAHVDRPGYLLAAKLRLRVAALRSRTNRILRRNPPATSRAFAAESLEQAMAHVASQEAAEPVTPLRRGLLDAPVKVVLSLVLTLQTPQLRPVLGRYVAHAIVHPATASSLPSVLDDLLKLAIVHRTRDEVTVERSANALRRVTWDRSAAGGDIRWPLPIGRSIRVSVGEPGRHVHEFRSLPTLAARFPAEIARALP
jgi:hypothetical protein